MTALCSGGGPSHPKAGVVDDLIYATGYLGLIDLAPGWEWLIPAIPLLGNLAYHTPDLCATDPPAFPTFTPGDALALAIADPGQAGHDARQKVSDVLTRIAWNVLCECISGPQPTIPAATTMPAQPTVLLPAPAGTSPCQTQALAGIAGSATAVGVPMVPDRTWVINAAATSVRVTGVLTPGTGAHVTQILWPCKFWSVSNVNILNTASPTGGPGSTTVFTLAIPPGAYQMSVIPSGNPSSNTDIPSATLEFFCNGDQPGGTVNTCGSDALSADLLRQILAQVNIIQRYRVPFAYVAGAVHSGLTGSGTLTVPQCIGAQITLTATGSAVGIQTATPLEYWEAGWFSWGNASGFLPKRFITKSPMLDFPDQAEQFTRFAYNLGQGVTASVTELYAEP